MLDPAEARNTARKMFGKEELAAVLRFGALELFKDSEQVNLQGQSIRPRHRIHDCYKWLCELALTLQW